VFFDNWARQQAVLGAAMKNVWLEFLQLKTDFPLGSWVQMTLDPLDDYFESIWASDMMGVVTGYNIMQSLVVVYFDNNVTMQCGPKLLKVVESPLVHDWDM
jgi:hypothetical protein